MKTKRKSGFTLAETLLTLVIIGVVMMLCIPAFQRVGHDKEYFASYKKAVSVLSQVVERMNAEHKFKRGNLAESYQNFKTYFNIASDCSAGGKDPSECWDYNADDQGPCQASEEVFVDMSGMVWARTTDNVWGFVVDTNGDRGPNHFGKDRWCLYTVDNDGNYTDGKKKPISVKPYPNQDILEKSDQCKFPPCYYQSAISR